MGWDDWYTCSCRIDDDVHVRVLRTREENVFVYIDVLLEWEFSEFTDMPRLCEKCALQRRLAH